MVACVCAIWFMLSASMFRIDAVHLDGDLRYTAPDVVLARLGLPAGSDPSVVQLRSDEMRREVIKLPGIADAQVHITLPNNVHVSVTERVPVFALRRGPDEYLVDSSGAVVARVASGLAESLGLPVVEDQRTTTAPIDAGASLDPIDLAAMEQLGALTPALVGSSATSLALTITDDDGYVVTAQPAGWRAVFGEYTPTLRPVDIIPRQVQCLRSLVGDQESDLATIYLAPMDERCGTFLPQPSARATPTPEATR